MAEREITVNRILERSLLYDFYGELLTAHQKEIYEEVVLGDYSLSEVADARGISRQGVHDLVRRCDRALAGYEEKLHLVKRFLETNAQVSEIQEQVGHYRETRDDAHLERIEELCDRILEEMREE